MVGMSLRYWLGCNFFGIGEGRLWLLPVLYSWVLLVMGVCANAESSECGAAGRWRHPVTISAVMPPERLFGSIGLLRLGLLLVIVRRWVRWRILRVVGGL